MSRVGGEELPYTATMMATIALVCITALAGVSEPSPTWLAALQQDADTSAGSQMQPQGDPADGGAQGADTGRAVEPPLEEGPDLDRRLSDDQQRTTPTAEEPGAGLSAWDMVHIVVQTSIFAGGGWVVATPMAAAFFLAAGGIIPAGLSWLVLVPAAPLLFVFPPLAVAGAAAAAGWGRLSTTGIAAVAGIGGAASMAAALVIGPFALWRLFTPPPPSERYNPGLLFRVTWTMAAGALWVIPAAAGGLAAGIAAPFFLKGPQEGLEGDGAEGETAAGG